MGLKRPFGVAGLIYLIIASVLLPYMQYYADNPDTFQYISIAKKYQVLDWAHAINGYWSPLISWLLVVPIAAFDDSVTAFKMLNIAIGMFVLFQWSRLLTVSILKDWLKYILAILAVPFLISYSFLNLTPDLLFTGMILWLLNVFLSGNITKQPAVALTAGIAGGLLYYTKAFGLPLFMAISIVVIIFERSKEKTNFRSIVIMYVVFLGLCSVWIGNISFHYSEFTISKSFSFNRSLSMDALEGRTELAVLGSGIIKPENNHLSAWEAPGDYVQSVPGKTNFQQVLKRNLLSIYYFDFSRQIGIIFILLLLMYIYRKGKEIMNEKWTFLLLCTIILVYGGYGLILVHSRYLWINTFLMLALSSVFIQLLIKSNFFKNCNLFPAVPGIVFRLYVSSNVRNGCNPADSILVPG